MNNDDETQFIPPANSDDTQVIPVVKDEPSGLHPAVGVLVVAAISIFGSGLVFAGATAALNDSPPAVVADGPIVLPEPTTAAPPAETPSATPSPSRTTASPTPRRTTAKPRPTTARPTPKKTAPKPKPTTAKPPAPGGSAGHSALEAEVIRLVNVSREAAGCRPVAANSGLAAFAQAHSDKQQAEDRMHHSTGPSGFRMWGENVARGYSSAAGVHQAWMDSPGHRRNILNCSFTVVGVGFTAYRPGSTAGYWTEVFGG